MKEITIKSVGPISITVAKGDNSDKYEIMISGRVDQISSDIFEIERTGDDPVLKFIDTDSLAVGGIRVVPSSAIQLTVSEGNSVGRAYTLGVIRYRSQAHGGDTEVSARVRFVYEFDFSRMSPSDLIFSSTDLTFEFHDYNSIQQALDKLSEIVAKKQIMEDEKLQVKLYHQDEIAWEIFNKLIFGGKINENILP